MPTRAPGDRLPARRRGSTERVSECARRARAATRPRPARRAGRRAGAPRAPGWRRSSSSPGRWCAGGSSDWLGERRSALAETRRRRRPSVATLSRPDKRDKDKLVRCARRLIAADESVRERDAEALLRVGEPLVLAVVAVALGMREDDDAIGRERRQGVLQRNGRLRLAGVSGGVHTLLLEP